MKRNNLIALALELAGVLVATVSAGAINIALGGCVLGAGLVCFGIAFEEGDG